MGELSGVREGAVELILRNGSKGEIGVERMSEVDKKYLDQTLGVEDKRLLWQQKRDYDAGDDEGFLM